MPIRAVILDYGHTIVDFRRTEEALLEAYRQIRERIEAALEIDAPEVGHLIDRVANEVDRLVGASYEERRMEELDVLQVFDEVLRGVLGLEVPRDVVGHIVALDHSAFTNTITVSSHTKSHQPCVCAANTSSGIKPIEPIATIFRKNFHPSSRCTLQIVQAWGMIHSTA